MPNQNAKPPMPTMFDTGYPMTSQRRNLLLRIFDNYVDQLGAITNRLHFLDEHFPPNKLDAALTWLISNSKTGKAFLRFYKEECMGSDLEMHRKLLQVVDNLNKPQSVIAGKNFKL